ncbi:hypothetical protein BASA81_001213 [Batrachochytrium salamandrivorans]|nr:hypothetical protein BASA81_001213 [Batrachochytrium salamandrivorans]
MDEHKSQVNLLHLFLEYLSVGQYELARLVYLQERHREAKFKRVVKLLVCGFRPQEWIYTPSCPSASHLIWFSARLLFEQDSVPDSLVGPRLLLGGNALLQQEAGVLVQEQFRFAAPSSRLDVLVDFLLRDEARLCNLLCAPDQHLLHRMVGLVWEDLQEHFKSDGDCSRVVTSAIDQLVAQNRVRDAAALFARSRRTQACPESLAKLAGGEEDARLMAKAMLDQGCFEPAKHASMFRHRLPVLGGEGTSMHAMLLVNLRQGHANWFSALVDDPYACLDVLPVLKAFDVLTTPGRNDLFRAVAIPALDATSFQRSMQLYVNQLAYESICAKVNQLVACGPSSSSLLTPLLLLSVVGLGEEPRVSSHALFQTVSRLFEDNRNSEWLSPSQRNEVLSVCMACWVSDPSFAWPAEFNCTAEEEVWLVRFLAKLDLSLVGPFLRFVRHSQVKTEYQLRLQVAALVADVRERALLEYTVHDLVAVCFAHRQWDLAIDLLHFFSKQSPVAVTSSSLLLHEAQVLQALQRQQNDFAFGAADQQDFEFQRHELVFTEWESGRKRKQTAKLVEANFKSADLFLVACAQSQLDALQVLVEYHIDTLDDDDNNNKTLFHELALAVESKRPFPTPQAAQAFRVLVGLESHPIYSVLCGEEDDGLTAKRLRNSVYSLQEDVEDRLRKAAKCLGFELHLSAEWAITGFASDSDGGSGDDGGEINPNAALDALRGVEHGLAIEFCAKLQAHLDHNAMASSYERWMLTEAMDLLQDAFHFTQ